MNVAALCDEVSAGGFGDSWRCQVRFDGRCVLFSTVPRRRDLVLLEAERLADWLVLAGWSVRFLVNPLLLPDLEVS